MVNLNGIVEWAKEGIYSRARMVLLLEYSGDSEAMGRKIGTRHIAVVVLLVISVISFVILQFPEYGIVGSLRLYFTILAIVSLVMAIFVLLWMRYPSDRVVMEPSKLTELEDQEFPEGTYLGPYDWWLGRSWSIYQDKDRKYPDSRKRQMK